MSEMLGNRYLLELRFEDAIPQFEAQLRVQPCDRRMAEKLALCHALVGNRDAAERWFLRALEVSSAEAQREDALWSELAQSLSNERNALGTERRNLGLALTRLFQESVSTTRALGSSLIRRPETAWLHDVLLSFRGHTRGSG